MHHVLDLIARILIIVQKCSQKTKYQSSKWKNGKIGNDAIDISNKSIILNVCSDNLPRQGIIQNIHCSRLNIKTTDNVINTVVKLRQRIKKNSKRVNDPNDVIDIWNQSGISNVCATNLHTRKHFKFLVFSCVFKGDHLCGTRFLTHFSIIF